MLVRFATVLQITALIEALLGKSSLINSLLDTPELAIQVRNRPLIDELD